MLALPQEGLPAPDLSHSLAGRPALLSRTLDRLSETVDPDRTFVVIPKGHTGPLAPAMARRPACPLLEEPCEAGSLASVLLATTYVRERDPDAVVLVCPADLDVSPEARFTRYLEALCRLSARHPGHLFFLTAPPAGQDGGVDWVLPARRGALIATDPTLPPALRVEEFLEGPSRRRASLLRRCGGQWNTGVAAFRASTLWDLGWSLEPLAMCRFDTLRQVLHAAAFHRAPASHEEMALRRVFHGIEPLSFSREILKRASPWALAVPMEGVVWNRAARRARLKPLGARPGAGLNAPAAGAP